MKKIIVTLITFFSLFFFLTLLTDINNDEVQYIYLGLIYYGGIIATKNIS